MSALRPLLVPLLLALLAGCAQRPAGVAYADADDRLAFEKEGFRVADATAFRFDVLPSETTRREHGVEPGRWIGVNVTMANDGARPRRLAGPAEDAYALVDPFDVLVVSETGEWAKVFTGRRWKGDEMVDGDIFAPGESGTMTLMFFDSQKVPAGPIAFFIGDEGVRLPSVAETAWTFRT